MDPEDPPSNEPTVPRASDAPFPEHDSLPAHLLGEVVTEPAPSAETQAIIDALVAALNARLDERDKLDAEQRSGLRLELNQIRETQLVHGATLAIIKAGVLQLSADLVDLQAGVADQIDLAVKKRTDPHLSVVELAELEAANGSEL